MVPIDSDQTPRQVMAAEIIGQVTGSLVRRMAENQDFLHAPIVSSVMGLRNMAIRLFTVKIIMIAVLMLAASGTGAAEKISLQALFKDKPIIVDDGARRARK